MATEKAETDRIPVTLALSTITYLEKLVRQGTHGTSVPGVARTLIEEGIRLAIKDGLLSIRDNGKASTGRRERGSPRIGTANMFATAPTWTTERVELLKSHFEAGLSCRQIAAEIGVSRNAVIGKLSRLGLTRDKPGGMALARNREERRGRSVPRLQYEMLREVYDRRPINTPVVSEHRCSLFELGEERLPLAGQWRCGGFSFCGNPPLEGLPYCPGTRGSPIVRWRGAVARG